MHAFLSAFYFMPNHACLRPHPWRCQPQPRACMPAACSSLSLISAYISCLSMGPLAVQRLGCKASARWLQYVMQRRLPPTCTATCLWVPCLSLQMVTAGVLYLGMQALKGCPKLSRSQLEARAKEKWLRGKWKETSRKMLLAMTDNFMAQYQASEFQAHAAVERILHDADILVFGSRCVTSCRVYVSRAPNKGLQASLPPGKRHG